MAERGRALGLGASGKQHRDGRASQWMAGLRAVILLLTLGLPALLLATAPLLFERVGDPEKVKDGVVTGLAQDGEGFVWVATTEGLVRFDGLRFRTYLAQRDDPASLPGNVVRVLMRARDGRLWLGTEAEGVARYDPLTDGFERFDEADGVPRLPVRALAEDAEGRIWVGTSGGGLRRLDPRMRRTEVWCHDPADPASLADDRISAMLVDREGQLWIGTWRGLLRRRHADAAFERVLSDPGDPLGFANARIRAIAQTANGDIWVGAQQGQVAVLPAFAVTSASAPTPETARRWAGHGFSSLAEPVPGEVWLGHAAGIDVHALDDARLLRTLRPSAGQTLALDAAEVRALLVDASGLLWVGSFGGGLQRTDPRPRGLSSRRFQPGLDPPMPEFNVLTMGEDGGGGAWLGLAGVGVARMGPDLAVTEWLSPGTVARGDFEGDQPSGIAVSDDGALWVGTEQGLFRRASGTQTFQRIADASFLEGSAVRRLWAGRDGGMWVGTAYGLFHADATPGDPKPLTDPEGQPVAGSIEAMAVDAEGAWVGGSPGLYRLDGATRLLRPVATRLDGAPVRLDINGLLVDREGTLWIDANGLYRGTRASAGEVDLEPVSARHGEEGVSFGANLLDDARGRIWTQHAVYDPASDAFRPLLAADGAQVGTGWFRAYARLGGGRLAFGGREGVLVVEPDAFAPWGFEPPVVLTGVTLDGQRAAIGPAAREIHLAGQRTLSIEFAALDFSAPGRNRYRYRLEGVDAGWVETSAEQRLASYGNLWPGRYRFIAEGSNRTGAWSPRRLELDVVVAPRWWQTPLFMVTTGALLLLGSWGLVRWRTDSLRRAQLRLEQEVERRTAELRVLSEALRVRTREFEEASLTDPLTGLRNRRFMALEMRSEMALWMRRRTKAPVGEAPRDMVVFLIDVDHFKVVNDRFGHAAGDELLRQFALRLREVFRGGDHLVRWGGEEFLVVARDTDRRAAAELAERVRATVAGTPFIYNGTPIAMTTSVGYAPLPWDPERPQALDWEAVVALADLALYTIKQDGRNGWLGLLPEEALPAEADLAWVMKRLARLAIEGRLTLASNHNTDRLAHLLAAQSR